MGGEVEDLILIHALGGNEVGLSLSLMDELASVDESSMKPSTVHDETFKRKYGRNPAFLVRQDTLEAS